MTMPSRPCKQRCALLRLKPAPSCVAACPCAHLMALGLRLLSSLLQVTSLTENFLAIGPCQVVQASAPTVPGSTEAMMVFGFRYRQHAEEAAERYGVFRAENMVELYARLCRGTWRRRKLILLAPMSPMSRPGELDMSPMLSRPAALLAAAPLDQALDQAHDGERATDAE